MVHLFCHCAGSQALQSQHFELEVLLLVSRVSGQEPDGLINGPIRFPETFQSEQRTGQQIVAFRFQWPQLNGPVSISSSLFEPVHLVEAEAPICQTGKVLTIEVQC
jgi:hypothetical protein